MMTDREMKHLELIQKIITRMNTNSFQIKTFTASITSALLAAYAFRDNELFIVIASFQTIVFWFLDSFYLQQERKFRGIYNHLVNDDKQSLKFDIKNFEMPLCKFTGDQYDFRSSFWSLTARCFYLVILVYLVFTFVYIKYL